MRHQKHGRKLSRPSAHRWALYQNLVTSLMLHERIETTEPKAKELKRLADRTISWGTSVGDLLDKEKSTLTKDERARMVHAIRMARRMIRTEEACNRLFEAIAPRLRGRTGGYTRLLKTRTRVGDAAPMALVEIIGRKAPEKVVAPTEGGEAKGEAKAAKGSEAKPKAAKPAGKAKAAAGEAAAKPAKPTKRKKKGEGEAPAAE